jgi:formylmethanofuran dehydrogenase subunit C
MANLSELEICKLVLHGRTAECIGDFFDVSAAASFDDSMILRGDLSNFHHLAAAHVSGTIEIDGDAGDCLGAAMEGCRTGMSGGRILVRGKVGKQAGYRMRRGEIFVAGDAGDFLAAHLIAGTICVAGKVGNHVGYGMRRGSLLLASDPSLPTNRFSRPIPVAVNWIRLLAKVGDQKLDRLLERMVAGDCRRSRGDAAAAGVGELLWAI